MISHPWTHLIRHSFLTEDPEHLGRSLACPGVGSLKYDSFFSDCDNLHNSASTIMVCHKGMA